MKEKDTLLPSRELTLNRRVGQRKRSPHESFSLVSSYSSVSKRRGDSPFIMGKGITVPARERKSEPDQNGGRYETCPWRITELGQN
jgi:hypothetical protein